MDLSEWTTALVGVVVVVLVVGLLIALVTAVALASWGRFPLWLALLVTIGAPVVGPVVLAILALARSGGIDEQRPTWLDRGRWTVRGSPFVGRRGRLLLLAMGLAGLAALLVVPIARLHAGAAFTTPVYLAALPFGGPLLLATFALAALIAALAARRTTRSGAVGAALLGGFWATLTAATLLLSVPMTGVLHLADRYIGNALSGVVLSLLRTSGVPAADVATGIRESVSTRVGAGVWVALVGAVLVLMWSVLEVAVAHRAIRSAPRASTLVPEVPITTRPVSPADPGPDAWGF